MRMSGPDSKRGADAGRVQLIHDDREGAYFAFAVKYSAVAIHAVNQTVHVDGYARVLSLSETEEQELHVGRHFPIVRRFEAAARPRPHANAARRLVDRTRHTALRGPRDRT